MWAWRSRAVLEADVILLPEEYRVREAAIRIMPIVGEGTNNKVRVAEMLLPEFDGTGIDTVTARSIELFYEFLDRVSVVAYGAASIRQWISTCPYFVRTGEEFEIALLGQHFHQTAATLAPSDISKFEEVAEDSYLGRVCRCLRIAIGTADMEERFRYLFLALEEIAYEETHETIKVKCKKCGAEYDSGRRATTNKMRELVPKDNGNTKIGDLTDHRGRVLHQGAKRDLAFAKKSTQMAASLQYRAWDLLLERIGTEALRRDSFLFFLPADVHRFKALDHRRCLHLQSRHVGGFQLAKITQAKVGSGGTEWGTGFAKGFKPQIPGAAWPEIESMEETPIIVSSEAELA